jgi:hypothetical protein
LNSGPYSDRQALYHLGYSTNPHSCFSTWRPKKEKKVREREKERERKKGGEAHVTDE